LPFIILEVILISTFSFYRIKTFIKITQDEIILQSPLKKTRRIFLKDISRLGRRYLRKIGIALWWEDYFFADLEITFKDQKREVFSAIYSPQQIAEICATFYKLTKSK